MKVACFLDIFNKYLLNIYSEIRFRGDFLLNKVEKTESCYDCFITSFVHVCVNRFIQMIECIFLCLDLFSCVTVLRSVLSRYNAFDSKLQLVVLVVE